MSKDEILRAMSDMTPGVSAVGFMTASQTTLGWLSGVTSNTVFGFFSTEPPELSNAIRSIASSFNLTEGSVRETIACAHRDDAKEHLAVAISKSGDIVGAFQSLKSVTVEMDSNYLLVDTFVKQVLKQNDGNVKMSESDIKDHCLAFRKDNIKGIQDLLRDLHKRGAKYGGLEHLSNLAGDYQYAIETVMGCAAPMAGYAGESYGLLARMGSEVFSHFVRFSKETRTSMCQFFYKAMTESDVHALSKEFFDLIKTLSQEQPDIVDDIVKLFKKEKEVISRSSGLSIGDVEDITFAIEEVGNSLSIEVLEKIMKGISDLEQNEDIMQHISNNTITLDHLDKVAQVMSVLDEKAIPSDVIAKILDMDVMQDFDITLAEGVKVNPVLVLKSLVKRFSNDATLKDGLENFRAGLFDYGQSLEGVEVISIDGNQASAYTDEQMKEQLSLGRRITIKQDGNEKTLLRKPLPALKTVVGLLNDVGNIPDPEMKANNIEKAMVLLVRTAQPSTFKDIKQFLPEADDLISSMNDMISGMEDKERAEKVIHQVFMTYKENNYVVKVPQAYVKNLLSRTLYSKQMRPYEDHANQDKIPDKRKYLAINN